MAAELSHQGFTNPDLALAHDLVINPLSDRVAFPRLSHEEMAEASRFGEERRFPAGEALHRAGDYPFHCYVIVSGEIRVVDVSTAPQTVFIRYGQGYFTGDIDLFTGRPSVVTVEADTDVIAICIEAGNLREMFVRKTALGERFWKSFQRRRELLLASRFQGVSIYGSKHHKETLEAVELLFRNGVPHRWFDTALEENNAKLRNIKSEVQRYPAIAYGNRFLAEAPTRTQLAELAGLRHKTPSKQFDVVILGSGPAGLGAAVYAASEGLSALVLDSMGPGGQAGSSSKIENYAGFPDGISGRELAHGTYLQALRFGAEFVAPSTVVDLQRLEGGSYRICTSEGDYVIGKTVIAATGVSYRLLNVKGLENLRGSGVHYNATKIEAQLCKGGPVHVVGAGNSAGQAAMFLSHFDCMVSLLVRGRDIRKSMSSYLVDRLLANERVHIRYGTEVIAIAGIDEICGVTLRDSKGVETEEPTAGLFIFIGAKPRTNFLPASIARDDKNYLLTGSTLTQKSAWKEERLPFVLETSLPGVFAAGDCRSGTSKRVAFAISDGAVAIACIHHFMESKS